MIIYKIDLKDQELHKTYVQYEVYNPLKLEQLDLSICKDTTIIINTPVQLDDATSILFDSLKESGYNLFNESDSFYNDVCSTYTSLNKTDITLADRKQIIFNNNGNITLCQTGCELEYYNSKTRKAKCKCSAESNKFKDILDSSYIKLQITMISENLINTIKNANFVVLKCYKNALDLSTIWTNIGRIYMLINLLLSLILMFYFCIKDSKNIDNILQSFLISNNNSFKTNLYKLENKKEKIKIRKSIKKKKRKSIEIVKKNANNNNKKKLSKLAPPKHNNNNKNLKIIENDISKNNEHKSKSKILLKDEIYNSIKSQISNKDKCINIIKIKNVNIGNIYKNKKLSIKANNNLNKNKNRVNKKKIRKAQSFKISLNTYNNLKNNESNTNEKTLNNNNLNDYELNSLDYKNALLIDKRTFSQYYWSLLKRKQLILFTFCLVKDYNLLSIKLYLFLMYFYLSITFTGFFFDNETMHNIFIDNGTYNIIDEFSKILLSSLITSVINLLLRQLSLSEKNFLTIKNEKNLNLMKIKCVELKRHLKCKFASFFILSNLLLIFCLYFISCFCSIYQNTQTILIIDTILSFCVSMIYPFGLYLLPTIFRILALRASKKDKVCLYKFGYFISLL